MAGPRRKLAQRTLPHAHSRSHNTGPHAHSRTPCAACRYLYMATVPLTPPAALAGAAPARVFESAPPPPGASRPRLPPRCLVVSSRRRGDWIDGRVSHPAARVETRTPISSGVWDPAPGKGGNWYSLSGHRGRAACTWLYPEAPPAASLRQSTGDARLAVPGGARWVLRGTAAGCPWRPTLCLQEPEATWTPLVRRPERPCSHAQCARFLGVGGPLERVGPDSDPGRPGHRRWPPVQDGERTLGSGGPQASSVDRKTPEQGKTSVYKGGLFGGGVWNG